MDSLQATFGCRESPGPSNPALRDRTLMRGGNENEMTPIKQSNLAAMRTLGICLPCPSCALMSAGRAAIRVPGVKAQGVGSHPQCVSGVSLPAPASPPTSLLPQPQQTPVQST